MSNGPGYHNRQAALAATICSLFYDLGPSTYDEIAPRLTYWIEYTLTEQLTTIDDLVERVSPVAWDQRGSYSHISQFLKEFRDTPHLSERMRSFIDELCHHVLRWFAAASVDDLKPNWHTGSVSKNGGYGFVRAASFVGHLIKRGLLGRELVRRHLTKPLTIHRCNSDDSDDITKQAIRATAIYSLFNVAGKTLLQGLLEPEDIQICFERMEARISLGEIPGLYALDTARLDVRCDSYLDTSR